MRRHDFYTRIRQSLGPLNQGQVDGFEVLQGHLSGAPQRPVPLSHAAYLLATAWHESAHTMQPVRETLASSDAQAIARLEAAWRNGRLPQVKRPYWRPDAQGRSWFGRGYVQLTHQVNYRKAGALIGVDLLSDPDLALDADIAAQILIQGCQSGLFTGRRLADYLPGDWIGARRVINGSDRAQPIATLASAIYAALREGYPT